MSRGRFERKKEKPRASKVVLIVLIVILVLVLALAAAGVSYYYYAISRVKQVEVPKIQYTTVPTEPQAQLETEATEEETTAPTETVHVPSSEDYINFLVVGQASRAGDEERMADSMILVTLNTYEKSITLTSILRDTLVQQGGRYCTHSYGGGKINAMYHMGYLWDGTAGSMAVMNQILYDNFGIEVDHNIEVSFDAFTEAIYALGGIEIELTQEEADYLNGDDVWVKREMKAGKEKLNGMAALSYVRMRKAVGDGESDIVRTERQRKFIEAVVAKMKQMDLGVIQKAVDRVLPHIATSMTTEEITDTLLTMLTILPELKMNPGGQCPASGWGDVADIYGDGTMHSVMKFNVQQTKKEMRAITEGEIYE